SRTGWARSGPDWRGPGPAAAARRLPRLDGPAGPEPRWGQGGFKVSGLVRVLAVALPGPRHEAAGRLDRVPGGRVLWRDLRDPDRRLLPVGSRPDQVTAKHCLLRDSAAAWRRTIDRREPGPGYGRDRLRRVASARGVGRSWREGPGAGSSAQRHGAAGSAGCGAGGGGWAGRPGSGGARG